MLDTIAWVSLAFAVVTFLLFVYFVIRPRKPELPEPPASEAAAAPFDPAALVEAFAKLAAELAKAGPTTVLLIATMFFLVVSAVCGGLVELPGMDGAD